MYYANIITYLKEQNEENIMKKMLLDICFKEIKGVSLYMIDKNDILIKKLTQLVVNKSSKYPKDSVFFTQGEELKYAKLVGDY